MGDTSNPQTSAQGRLNLLQPHWHDWSPADRIKYAKPLAEHTIPTMLATEWQDKIPPPGQKYRFTEIADTMAINDLHVDRGRKWIHLVECDSIEAVNLALSSNPTARIVVLNHADEKNAGGLLYKGSRHQEQSLCVRTTLFRSLDQPGNYPLLDDELIYSRRNICFDVVPGRGLKSGTSTQIFDIVSCAAIRNPEVTKTKNGEPAKYVDENEIVRETTEKLKHIMRISVAEGQDTVVLGAFGCGGSNHPPARVAQITKDVLTSLENDWRARGIKDVIIAIYDRKPGLPVWTQWTETFQSGPNVGFIDGPEATKRIYGLIRDRPFYSR